MPSACPGTPGYQIAETLGNAVQLTNILRDVKEDAAIERLYVPLDMAERHGVVESPLGSVFIQPGFAAACAELAELARGYYAKTDRLLAQLEWASDAPHRAHDDSVSRDAPAPGRTGLDAHRQSGPADTGAKVVARPALRAALTSLLSVARTHIIGAGVAGLSVAVSLAQAGHAVILYEASGQAGGRCRSYSMPGSIAPSTTATICC